jgi:hypothetical protein
MKPEIRPLSCDKDVGKAKRNGPLRLVDDVRKGQSGNLSLTTRRNHVRPDQVGQSEDKNGSERFPMTSRMAKTLTNQTNRNDRDRPA